LSIRQFRAASGEPPWNGSDVVFSVAYIGPGAGLGLAGSFFVLFFAGVLLVLSLATLPIRLVLLWYRRRAAGVRGRIPQVVVVGLDGLDPGRVRRLFAENQLPHLRKLADEGTFCELQTTLPPISPVAWSSFQTGVNPGKHNIFDFLNRDLRTYLPELSSVRLTAPSATTPGWRRWTGFGGTQVEMLRKSQPFWKILGRCGIFSTVIRVPISFPPEKFFGLSLSAMCTPDLHGTQGECSLYTTDRADAEAMTGGRRIFLERHGDEFHTSLDGPSHPAGPAERALRTPLRMRVDVVYQKLLVRVGGEFLRLGIAESTGRVVVSFRVGWMSRVQGLCQFRLESLTPHVRLYVSPIHLDPERPAMSISHPPHYAVHLAKLHGAFATAGLAEPRLLFLTRPIEFMTNANGCCSMRSGGCGVG
jgi:hypothetical protein